MWDSIRRHLYSFVEKIMHYNDTNSQTQVHNYLNVKVSKNTIIFGHFHMQSIYDYCRSQEYCISSLLFCSYYMVQWRMRRGWGEGSAGGFE